MFAIVAAVLANVSAASVLFWGAQLAVAAGCGIHEMRSTRRHQAALESFAETRGWTYTPRLDPVGEPQLPAAGLAFPWTSARPQDVVEGTWRLPASMWDTDRPVVAFATVEYPVQIGEEPTEPDHRWHLALGLELATRTPAAMSDEARLADAHKRAQAIRDHLHTVGGPWRLDGAWLVASRPGDLTPEGLEAALAQLHTVRSALPFAQTV